MAQSQFRVEIGAWVESTTPKASGKGMRKVWAAPAPKNEAPRLSVIRAGERGDVHVITLHVGTAEQAGDALEALSLALDALGALPAFTAPAPVAPKAPRVPTPPKAPAKNPTIESGRDAIIRKAREERAALSLAPAPVTRNPAPAKAAKAAKAAKPAAELDWFASLMHDAGAV